MKILVTGAAGFIGFHLIRKLAADFCEIVGLDNLNDYYPVSLKTDRLLQLGVSGPFEDGKAVGSTAYPNYRFVKADLTDKGFIDRLFGTEKFDVVFNLAAQAGVRYSIDHPYEYIASNINGFMNVLEACRAHPVKHLVFASSSSIYGLNRKVPFSESDPVDHPVSLYAATKKSSEMLAHAYSYLYGIPSTGVRFFTVYGPWGRPDMAYFSFTKKILSGETIDIFNNGKMRRDFTYIDDIVESLVRLMDIVPEPLPADTSIDFTPHASHAPFTIYNIGNHDPVELEEFVSILEDLLGTKAVKRYLPMQPGDVVETYADTLRLREAAGFQPKTPLREGLARFTDWYRSYYSPK